MTLVLRHPLGFLVAATDGLTGFEVAGRNAFGAACCSPSIFADLLD
jgi:hypothetical protein